MWTSYEQASKSYEKLLWKQEIGNRVENFALTEKSNSANLGFLYSKKSVVHVKLNPNWIKK